MGLQEQSSSLGVICAGEVEVRAFGPQALPLSDDLRRFGVKDAPLDGWACCLGMPEVWIEVKTHLTNGASQLDVRFVGLKPEAPLAFVFYVKALSCTIAAETLRPKSLRRFNGEAQAVVFQNQVKIASSHQHKVQVVPLAGDGSFWDSQFLVAFEIHPFVPQATFHIS